MMKLFLCPVVQRIYKGTADSRLKKRMYSEYADFLAYLPQEVADGTIDTKTFRKTLKMFSQIAEIYKFNMGQILKFLDTEAMLSEERKELKKANKEALAIFETQTT